MLKDKFTLSARDILKKESGELRTFRKFEQWLVYSIAISWALFQLALADLISTFFFLFFPFHFL